ncbi:MAG TPA: YebC/PmpR family DNA-binding transcriptional regulator, partial [candidate division Zixibacteria bacterium]|nr:YebC/PmpR family DNA-binding transcriptional regulator [candidate division Zixibacteria bacterium]
TSEAQNYEIQTPANAFDKVKQALEKNKIPITSAEINMVPQSTVKLEGKNAEQMIKLMEALEEHEDVQKVYANFDIEETLMEKLSA